jgi:hypothetical protein
VKPADLRSLVAKMTLAPWYAHTRAISLVPDNTGQGATLHTNHVGNFVDRDDAVAVTALRNHATAILDALDLAGRLVDGNQPLSEQHAMRVALRCALTKMEEVK